ncbi:MAG: hypothetical protein LBF09_07175 [Odoribacteraceae bacterium]|jgi:hypothetical protein|nr:hypothetical protein [Odoribacteraceae bacterium]
MKKIFYLLLGGCFALFAASCGGDEVSTSDNEEFTAGSATIRLTVVDDATRQPLANVTVKHVLLKITETTGSDGVVTINLESAPRALVGLEFSHEIYDVYTTSVPIGEVKEGNNKEIEATIGMNMKAVNYVASLNVVDDSTFLPVQGVSILGLLTGADGTNEEGTVNIRLPGPGIYDLLLTHPEYDTLDFRINMPDEGGLPGETIRTDLGTLAMTLFSGFRIVPVDLSGEYDTQIIRESRGRGAITGPIITKSAYMSLPDADFTWSWNRSADFAGTDFDYVFSASAAMWVYPLCFKLHYEESPFASGCYRVEVVAFLEPFSPTGNRTYEDMSYYNPKKKQLVINIDMYESWNGNRGWDEYILTARE